MRIEERAAISRVNALEGKGQPPTRHHERLEDRLLATSAQRHPLGPARGHLGHGQAMQRLPTGGRATMHHQIDLPKARLGLIPLEPWSGWGWHF